MFMKIIFSHLFAGSILNMINLSASFLIKLAHLPLKYTCPIQKSDHKRHVIIFSCFFNSTLNITIIEETSHLATANSWSLFSYGHAQTIYAYFCNMLPNPMVSQQKLLHMLSISYHYVHALCMVSYTCAISCQFSYVCAEPLVVASC